MYVRKLQKVYVFNLMLNHNSITYDNSITFKVPRLQFCISYGSLEQNQQNEYIPKIMFIRLAQSDNGVSYTRQTENPVVSLSRGRVPQHSQSGTEGLKDSLRVNGLHSMLKA